MATVPTVNPLVVASVDQPADAWAGMWIAEDVELILQGVRNGSWIDGTLGVTGASLDALALISDPVGALLPHAWTGVVHIGMGVGSKRLMPPEVPTDTARSWSYGWRKTDDKPRKGNHNSKIAEI